MLLALRGSVRPPNSRANFAAKGNKKETKSGNKVSTASYQNNHIFIILVLRLVYSRQKFASVSYEILRQKIPSVYHFDTLALNNQICRN